MEITIGTATVDVDATSDSYPGEMLGDGSWEFAFKDLERFADEKMDIHMEIHEFDDDEKPEPDSTLTVSDADTAILLLYRMGRTGEKFAVSYEGPDSAYWAFHDIDHARNDVGDTDDGKGEIYIDGANEDRALSQGATLALEYGIPVADIVRELVKAESAFSERFVHDSSALESFCDSLESKLQKETV